MLASSSCVAEQLAFWRWQEQLLLLVLQLRACLLLALSCLGLEGWAH